MVDRPQFELELSLCCEKAASFSCLTPGSSRTYHGELVAEPLLASVAVRRSRFAGAG